MVGFYVLGDIEKPWLTMLKIFYRKQAIKCGVLYLKAKKDFNDISFEIHFDIDKYIYK